MHFARQTSHINSPAPPQPRRKLAANLAILCLHLTLAGCQGNPPSNPATPRGTTNPTSHANTLFAQGRLLPSSGIITIASLPGDRIEAVLVKPGDPVQAGQPLLRLLSERLKAQELDIAKQKLEEARLQANTKVREAKLALSLASAQHTQAEKQSEQVQLQLEILKSGEEQVAMAQRQLQKIQRLHEDPRTKSMVGSLELDQRKLEWQQLNAKQQQAHIAFEQTKLAASSGLELAQQRVDAAKETLAIAESSQALKSLEMQIEALQQQLEAAKVLAPIPGFILEVQAKPGETISTLPLLTMADLSNMSCLAEVHEVNRDRITVGDRVALVSAAFQNRQLHGTVERIDRVVGMPQMRLPNPMAKTDFRAVPVAIKIDPEDTELASLYVQLQVDVQFQAKP